MTQLPQIARAVALCLLLVGIGGVSASADQSPVNVNWQKVAIDGYDPVAYFTDGRPVRGAKAFQFTYMGATFRFASAANRDAFAKEPARYAPQYGAYCAYAVSKGYTADTDPNAWKIVDGKLYLNYNRGAQREWEKDVPGNIRKGDANWPGVLSK